MLLSFSRVWRKRGSRQLRSVSVGRARPRAVEPGSNGLKSGLYAFQDWAHATSSSPLDILSLPTSLTRHDFITMIVPRLATSSLRRGASPLARIAASSAASPRTFASSAARLASSLLYIEHKNGTINPASLVALTAASKVGGDVDGIVLGGDDVDGVVDKAIK